MKNQAENWARTGLKRAFAATHDPRRVGIAPHKVSPAAALPSVGALLLDAPAMLDYGLPVSPGAMPAPVARLLPEVWVWAGAVDIDR
jgi:hypothetical protein